MDNGRYLDEEEIIEYDEYLEALKAYGFNNVYNLKTYLDASEIIRKKKVDLFVLERSITNYDYNMLCQTTERQLSILEFTLCKAWLEGDVY